MMIGSSFSSSSSHGGVDCFAISTIIRTRRRAKQRYSNRSLLLQLGLLLSVSLAVLLQGSQVVDAFQQPQPPPQLRRPTSSLLYIIPTTTTTARGGRRGFLSAAAAVNGDDENDDDNKSDEKKQKKKKKRVFKRAADYPSFSYTEGTSSTQQKTIIPESDANRRDMISKYQQKLVRMKYQGCGIEEPIEFTNPSTKKAAATPTVTIRRNGKGGSSSKDNDNNGDDEDDDGIVPSWLKKLLVTTISGGNESAFLGEIGISALKTRLLKNRSYAKKEPFVGRENIMVPPSLSDLSYPPTSRWKGFWVGAPARLITGLIAYLVFPYLTSLMENFVTMEPQDLDEITSKFGPGISILYGTFISLTLSILYNRVKDIQDAAARESALLTLVTRNLLKLCQDDDDTAVEAAQCCADQIRTLVKSSRGRELLLVMYSDPYARMLEVLEYREEQILTASPNPTPIYNNLLGDCRDSIKNLIRMRSERLSMEALSLPPTHFLVLNLLTLLILLSYVVSILPTVDPHSPGVPSNESALLFAILTNVYVLFYYFAQDLNNPFDGVYQIRRSSSAVHLLEAKWLIANHPLTRGKVDFEEIIDDNDGQEESSYQQQEDGSWTSSSTTTNNNGVTIISPGLGEMYFETADDLLVDGVDGNSGTGNKEEEEKDIDCPLN